MKIVDCGEFKDNEKLKEEEAEYLKIYNTEEKEEDEEES